MPDVTNLDGQRLARDYARLTPEGKAEIEALARRLLEEQEGQR